jgi:hypothetical protein
MQDLQYQFFLILRLCHANLFGRQVRGYRDFQQELGA